MQKKSNAGSSALKVLLTGTSLLAGALAMPPDALAQTGASESDEIVVTARRREESNQDVPIAITAIGSERLDEAGVQDAMDLQEIAPGLAFTQGSDSRQNAAFNVRGVGQAFGGNLPSVLTYLSDVPLDYHGAATLGTFDLQSIQVARGPQGTLFGRNTTGGAVLITPRMPDGEVDGYVSIDVGNYSATELTAAASTGPIGDFSARIAVHSNLRDGASTNVFTGTDLDDRNSADIRAILRWEPSESLRNDLLLQFSSADEHGVAYVLQDVRANGSTAATGSAMDRALQQLYGNVSGAALYLQAQEARGIRNTEANSGDGMERDIFLAANTTTWDLNDNLTVKNILGYERVQTGYTTDIDGTRALVNYSQAQLGPPETDIEQISDELQLLGQSFDGNLDWVAGVFYLDSDTPQEEDGFVDSRESLSNLGHAPIPGVDINGVTHGTATSTVFSLSRNSIATHDQTYAGYLQGTLALDSLLQGLSFTAGGRYTWDRRASTFGQYSTINNVTFTCASSTGLPSSTPQAQCLRTITANFEGYGYTFGLDWQPTPDLLLYVTTRRNYKAGGQNFINTLSTSLLTYTPEYATDYEAGIKWDWNLGFLSGRTNLAVYNADYTDMQRQVTVNTGTAVATAIFNAASANIQGIELENTFHLTENLDFSLFYSHTDASYDRFTDPGTGGDLSANKLVGTPENSGGATLRYEHSLGRLGDFVGSVSYYGQSRMEVTANQIQNPFIFSPAYSLYNARIALENIGGAPVDLAIWGNNLADEEYVVAGLGLYGTTLGYNSVVYGDPQMYGLELTYRFHQ